MTSVPRSFAIIPACGESRRMGTDKLLLPWKHSTILETVIEAWQASQVDHIFVVIPQVRDDLKQVLAALPVHVVVADPRPTDMKGSIQVALRVIAEQFEPTPDDVWLVAPADMPTLSPVTIDKVLLAARELPGRIVIPTDGEKHGHPALFPWTMADEVFQLAEDQGLNALSRPEVVANVAAQELGQDVDTSEEFLALQKEQDTQSHHDTLKERPTTDHTEDHG